MKVLFSFILLLLFSTTIIVPVYAEEPEEPMLTEEKFFRQSIGVLWTYMGEETRSYVAEVRYGVLAEELLPNIFGQAGLVPTAIVSNIAYESNPAGEDGDAIWTEVTAYYDLLFDIEWLEGRAIYNDILLESYLGVGLGLIPIDNSWIGGYYLGSKGFKLYAECAYEIEDGLWPYFVYEYYIDSIDRDDRVSEGEIGIRYKDIYIKAENRLSEWIYAIGVTLAIE